MKQDVFDELIKTLYQTKAIHRIADIHLIGGELYPRFIFKGKDTYERQLSVLGIKHTFD